MDGVGHYLVTIGGQELKLGRKHLVFTAWVLVSVMDQEKLHRSIL
jgi:hypothetical protein